MVLKNEVSRVARRARGEALRWEKGVYHALHRFPPGADKRVVLILGCQRSGTTMMLDLLTEDLRSVTFPEQSVLSQPIGGRLRLRPLPEVRERIERLRVPLVVLKPLVESQNAHQLLDELRASLAIWMFRRFENVAASDLDYFGIQNGRENLRLLLSNDPPNWRADFVPERTRSVLTHFYSAEMDPYDAAALFWWARNSLYFELELESRADVRPVPYERLVSDPEKWMQSIYQALDLEYPRRQITKLVTNQSRERRAGIEFSPEVGRLCDELYERLLACTKMP
jgi:hypothetical protein